MLRRRDVLHASAGLAALSCTRSPPDRIVPYVVQPRNLTPGVARTYATSLAIDGYARGLLVQTREGRPIKVEGNPDHPASLGATSAIEQTLVHQLCDPRRSRSVVHGVLATTWDAMKEAIADATKDASGNGVWIVLEPTSSPTAIRLIEAIRARLPQVRLVFHTGAPRKNAWEGARLAFGRVVEPRLDFAAKVVVALDCDFLARGPTHLRDARAWADARMSGTRLYVAEPSWTATGASADERLAIRRGAIPALADSIRNGTTTDRWAAAVARDLKANGGIVVVGDAQPPETHAIAHAINGEIDVAPSPVFEAGEKSHELRELSDALLGGTVRALFLLGVDLSRTSPGDRPMSIARAAASFHLGMQRDPDAAWHAPELHPFEQWSDARAFDGTISIAQPTIEPLVPGKSVLEVLALLAGKDDMDSRALVAETRPDLRDALAKGFVPGSAFPTERVRASIPAPKLRPPDGIEIALDPDPRLHDGRFGGEPLLLELPDSVTKLTWTNAARMSPATAAKLGVKTGDIITIESVRIPVHVVIGEADESIAIALGWGRDNHGASAYPLVLDASRYLGRGPTIAKTAERAELAFTQVDFELHGREEEILGAIGKKRKKPLSLYPEAPRPEAPVQWGMTIDLARCTGCGSCIVACQAENNVPAVGREGVMKGRAMHWLRIDAYRVNERVELQPMLCQHCEKAPCEYVCPVNATTHSSDGLNQMAYQRCVGTRFCSNNCPYKVRRFNWFDWHADEQPIEHIAHNPDVTVRARGVMEKCTYCVQRIRKAGIHARIEGRSVADGEIQTACEQACPTRAIVFGDVADSSTRVAKLREDPRAYSALEDLGAEPRTRYLVRTRNRNPELA